MFELISVRDVGPADEVTVLRGAREAICDAVAHLPVSGYGQLHDHLGRTSALLSSYIDALTPRQGAR